MSRRPSDHLALFAAVATPYSGLSRTRRLRMETLEGRWAPSSLLVGWPLGSALGEAGDQIVERAASEATQLSIEFSTESSIGFSTGDISGQQQESLGVLRPAEVDLQWLLDAAKGTRQSASWSTAQGGMQVDDSVFDRDTLSAIWNGLAENLRGAFAAEQIDARLLVDEFVSRSAQIDPNALDPIDSQPAARADVTNRSGGGGSDGGGGGTSGGGSTGAANTNAASTDTSAATGSSASGPAGSGPSAAGVGLSAGGSAGVVADEAAPVVHGFPELPLLDAEGQPLNIAPDGSTVVVGAATWCGACAAFEAALTESFAAGQLEGLRVVFAFGHEGGSGPGGVRDAGFLDDLPGEVAFLGEDAPRPERYPTAFNLQSGQFDTPAVEAIRNWQAAVQATTADNPTQTAASTAGSTAGQGGEEPCDVITPLVGDYDGNGSVDAADYQVWRTSFGSTTELAADGNGNNAIDAADYTLWRDNLGAVHECVPGPFEITGPTETVVIDTFTVTWSPSAGADHYEVSLSTASDCSNPAFTPSTTATSIEFTVPGSGNKYICITAINEAGQTKAINQPFLVDQELPDPIQTLFATSEQTFPDNTDPTEYLPFIPFFAGADQADYLCSWFANQGGLIDDWDFWEIKFKAILATSVSDAIFRASVGDINTLNTNGEVVFERQSDLKAGLFSAQILDEYGNPLPEGTRAWTGATTDGMFSGFNAGDWNSINQSATYGIVNAPGIAWLDSGTQGPATLQTRLYCIGSDD